MLRVAEQRRSARDTNELPNELTHGPPASGLLVTGDHFIIILSPLKVGYSLTCSLKYSTDSPTPTILHRESPQCLAVVLSIRGCLGDTAPGRLP